MKIAVCALFILGALVLVQAEECHDAGDCTHVTCPENNYTLDCHNRQCTCTHTTATCSGDVSACSGSDCRWGWHCVDGRCRCGLGFGGGK